MTPHEVTILGGVTVSGRGRVVPLGGTNMPALLCVLALTPGRAVANDRLIGALWPDADAVRGRRSLASLVHQLNLAIDSVLGNDRSVRTVKGVGRTLRVDPSAIDAVRFERGVAAGEALAAAGRHEAAAAELSAALSLWHSEPFGGLDLAILVEPAAQFAGTRARAEAQLVDSALRSGHTELVQELLEQKVAARPEDEHAVASLARALYQSGRADDALDVVRRCIRLLRLRGIDPTPPLRRLETAIVDRALPGRDAPPRVRRAQPTVELIGRHAERAEIGNWWVGATAPRSTGRVLVIAGDPGMGKTTLVDAWMRGMADRFVAMRTRCSPEQILPFEAFGPLLMSGTQGSASDLRTREQLFELVARRLEALGDGDAVLLAIDDAQWLTPSSVALLEHLLADSRLHLRLVLTLRHHELEGNDALVRAFEHWQAGRQMQTLTLGPLSDHEIDALAARHAPVDPNEPARRFGPGDLRALTGGNPLLVIQVAQAGARGSGVPATVEHLLGRYLDDLPLGVRRGVETAALLGIDGSLATVAACTGRSELDEIEALDAVGGGRLLHVTPIDGTYRFVHELARQTVTSRIPPGRAMRLHLAIADGLDGQARPDVFAIAHHLRLAIPAVSAERASEALLDGARRARAMGDFESSRVLAEQTLHIVDDIAVHADVLVLMASAAQSLGDRAGGGPVHRLGGHPGPRIERHRSAGPGPVREVGGDVLLGQRRPGGAHRTGRWRAYRCLGRRWCRHGRGGVGAVPRSAGHRAAGPSEPGRAGAARGALERRRQGSAARTARQPAGRADDADRARRRAGLGRRGSRHRGADRRPDDGQSAHLAEAERARCAPVDWPRRRPCRPRPWWPRRWCPTMRMRGPRGHAAPAWRWWSTTSHTAQALVREACGIGELLAGSRPAEEYINHMGVLHLARGSLPGLHHLFGAWVDQSPGPIWHWAVASGELLDATAPEAIERRETMVANMGSPLPPHSDWLPELTIAAEYAASQRRSRSRQDRGRVHRTVRAPARRLRCHPVARLDVAALRPGAGRHRRRPCGAPGNGHRATGERRRRTVAVGAPVAPALTVGLERAASCGTGTVRP